MIESEPVRVVRRLWDLFNRLPTDPDERQSSSELSELLALFDPEVEFLQRGPQLDAGEFAGRDAMRNIWADWLTTWTTHGSRIEEIRERGDKVLVLSRERFTGRDQLAGETEGASILTIQGGRITRFETYLGARSIALEAFET